MAEVETFFIVKKGHEWARSSRPDLTGIPFIHAFSRYTYDAKKFRTAKDAKQFARKIGGEVWLFVPAIRKLEKVCSSPQKRKKCDNCRKYTGFDGCCKNPGSKYYREAVSIDDFCGKWEEKTDGRKRRGNPAVIKAG